MKTKKTVPVFPTIIQFFSSLAEFIINGLDVMPKASFVEILKGYKLPKNEAERQIAALDIIMSSVNHAKWIWEDEKVFSDLKPLLQQCHGEHIIFLQQALLPLEVIGATKDFNLMARLRTASISDRKKLSAIFNAIYKRLKQKTFHVARKQKESVRAQSNSDQAPLGSGAQVRSRQRLNDTMQRYFEK